MMLVVGPIAAMPTALDPAVIVTDILSNTILDNRLAKTVVIITPTARATFGITIVTAMLLTDMEQPLVAVTVPSDKPA